MAYECGPVASRSGRFAAPLRSKGAAGQDEETGGGDGYSRSDGVRWLGGHTARHQHWRRLRFRRHPRLQRSIAGSGGYNKVGTGGGFEVGTPGSGGYEIGGSGGYAIAGTGTGSAAQAECRPCHRARRTCRIACGWLKIVTRARPCQILIRSWIGMSSCAWTAASEASVASLNDAAHFVIGDNYSCSPTTIRFAESGTC